MKLPTLSRRFWIACSTLAVIGALFAYYLMVYVAGREEKLREEKYRALARYGENMIHTRKDYFNGILRKWERGREQYDSAREKLRKVPEKKTETLKRTRTLDRLYRSKKDQSCQSCYDVYALAAKIDSLQNIEISSEGPVRLSVADRAVLEKKLNAIVKRDFFHVQYDGYKGERQLDSLLHDHFDRIYFRFPGKNNNKRFGLFSIATKDFVYKPNQFDEFLIIKKYDESRHEHDGEHVVPANESYQTFSNRVDLHEIDSFMVVEKGLLTSRFGEIKLADTKYKLFVHSIEFSPGENWILCGLMKVENFNSQVRSVDPFVITTAILIVLFLLIAMPILKIVLMNSFERLTKINVWLAGFSVVCGSATFLLIIWSESDNLQAQHAINSELVRFSSAVKRNFENELTDIYNQLVAADAALSKPLITYRQTLRALAVKKADSLAVKKADSLTAKKSTHRDSLRKQVLDSTIIVQGSFTKKIARFQKKDFDKLPDQEKRVIEKTHQTPLVYPYFNFLIWLDSLGKPLITLSNKDIPITYSMPELKERKYFSWVMNDSLWYLPNSKPGERKLFTLQSIQSWVDSETEAGVAIRVTHAPRQSETVLMISTRLHSIMNPIVQPGYGFCILDETGEVWFHSDPAKNRQQNFVDEVNQKALVRAAIKGRMATSFDAEYEGNRCQLHIEPISNIPLYLAVFHDDEYQRAPAVLTLYFTFALVLIFFLFQGTQLLILFFCERRSSLARSCKSEYFLQVLRPNKDNTALYQYNSVVMVFVLILCIPLYLWGEIAAVVVFISLPILLMTFHQAMFQCGKIGFRQYLFLALSLLLFLLIDGLSFCYLDFGYRWIAAIAQVVFALVFISAYAYKKTNFFTSVFVKKIGSFFTKKRAELKDANSRPISKKANHTPDKTILISNVKEWLAQYPRVYYTNLTLWLIIISLLPVSFFYGFTRCEEWLRWTRYEQLEACQSEFARLKVLDEKAPFLHVDPLQRKHVEQMGRYLHYSDTHFEKVEKDKVPARYAATALEKLTFSAWPRLPDPFGISSAAVPKAAADKKWFYDISAENEGIGFTPDFRRVALPTGSDIQYIAAVETFNPFGDPYGLWFFLLIIVCFCLVVRTILFCTKYIFGINFIPQNFALPAGELQQKIKTARRAVVIGLPGSGKSAMTAGAFESTRTVDFQSEEGMVNPKWDTDTLPCIIHHFEYGVNNHAFNQRKLACLKDLLKTPNRQIIILSAMHPCVMTDVYRKWIDDSEGSDHKEKDDEKGKGMLQEYKAAARNWKDLLGEFEVYHKSIQPETYTQMSTDAITEELNACHHLKTLTRNPEFQQTTDCNDDFIFRVEETAEPYYHALWSALSRSEKLFLIDLASDGFVNLKCRGTLRMLMQKGLVVERESTLVVMNDSFKHFVTGQFKEDDEIEVAKQTEKKGAWYSIRLVLVLVLVAIVIFIALAQEELFKHLNAFIVALSGALAFLTRFGGLFGSGSKAKE